MPRKFRAVVACGVLSGVLGTMGCATSAVSTHTADVGLTLYGLEHGFVERNPVVGPDPGPVRLIAVKAGVLGVAWVVKEWLPQHEKLVWTISTMSGVIPAILNLFFIMKD